MDSLRKTGRHVREVLCIVALVCMMGRLLAATHVRRAFAQDAVSVGMEQEHLEEDMNDVSKEGANPRRTYVSMVFLGNGADAERMCECSYTLHGVARTLPTNEFMREGYESVDWCASKDCLASARLYAQRKRV